MCKLFLILTACFVPAIIFSQLNPEMVKYSELLGCKVDEQRFEFGCFSNVSYDKMPCFRDVTKRQFCAKLVGEKDSMIGTAVYPLKYELKIVADTIMINKSDRTIRISGKITGAWEGVRPADFGIYIGRRVDTIANGIFYLDINGNGDSIKVNDDIEVITNPILAADISPAFYMADFKKFEAFRYPADRGKEVAFDINAVIDEKSILVFGLKPGYAEIFEIGKLLANRERGKGERDRVCIQNNFDY